ncbi:MAG TPA: ATP-binding protein [Polyangiaceae bacterium]
MIDNVPTSLLVVRADGSIVQANRAWLVATGAAVGEPSSTSLFDETVVHGEDVNELRAAWEHALRSGAPFETECRLHQLGGGHRWYQLRASVLRTERGRPSLVLVSASDVHRYKVASQMRDEFLATVTHELRTPLTAILGWCNMLRAGLLEGDKVSRALETIARNAEMQSRLVGDLLDASRIATGKLRVQMEPLGLRRAVVDALDMVKPTAQAKGVSLSLDASPDDDVPTRGDPARMQQVIGNLLSNALKFTPAGGHVRVRLVHEGDTARISVSDDGPGLSPELLPHVFERFRQAEGARTRRQDGLGLGLAIVKHLVELHGGTVRAESEGPGKGATFTVVVPLAGPPSKAEKPPLSAPPAGSVPSSTLLEGIRVLLVDDSPDHRELVRLGLSSMGATVRTAADAAEALASLAEGRPDVIVSDIGMPDGDGYTLIRRVRALPRARGGDIPAIALTGYARPEDRRRAYAEGFQLHLTKPADLETLASLVAGLASEGSGDRRALCP